MCSSPCYFDQCCIIRSVPARTDGKSRTGMQTGTRHPHVPPRLKFRPISACFGRFGLFRPVSAGLLIPAGILFGFYFLGFQFSVPNLILISRSLGLFSALISQSLLSLLITPPVRLHGSTSSPLSSSLQPVRLHASSFCSASSSSCFDLGFYFAAAHCF